MPEHSISLARRLIKRHGRSVRLAKFETNAKSAWHEATEANEITLDAVFFSPNASNLGIQISYEERAKLSAIMMCAPGEQNMLDYNVVTDGIEKFKISSIEYLRPGGKTIIAYMMLTK